MKRHTLWGMIFLAALLATPAARDLRGAGFGRALAQDDFGFDLSDDSEKEKKKKTEKKAPPPKTPPKTAPAPKTPPAKAQTAGGEDLGLEALDLSGKSPEKEAMDRALDMMKENKFADAAVAFWDLYNNPKARQYFQTSEYQLAKALYRMGLYHSALWRFGQILDKGVEHKYFKTSMEWLFFISHKITDQSEVLKDVARYADIDFPPKYRDEFRFLLAKYFYLKALEVEAAGKPAPAAKPEEKAPAKKTEGDELGFDLGGDEEKPAAKGANKADDEGFGLDLEVDKKVAPSALPTDAVGFMSKSKSLLMQIPEDSKFFPRAKYLEGVILYQQGNFQEAVEAFKQVVRVLHPRTGKFRDDKLREDAFFQLARIHYEFKQFRNAIFYYDHINRDSEFWLESLFESSWAWFRLGKYQKALGNLITLDSPFFRDEYFPEGLVLKAVTYYENCRYPESNQIVKDFQERFGPLHKELDNLLKSVQSPEETYRKLLAIQKVPPSGATGKMLQRILKVALADKDLKLVNASVLEVEKELKRIGSASEPFRSSKLAKRLEMFLDEQHKKLVGRAGQITRSRLDEERNFLAGLLSQALRIKLENDTSELEVLKRVEQGEQDLGPTLLPYDWTAATDDEKLFWPYQGEFWRDELGTYEYTLTWGCRKQVD